MRLIPPWVLGVQVGAVVVAALVTVVVTGRGADELPAGSPEATVQEYVDAVLDGDADAVEALFVADNDCDYDQLDHYYVEDSVRVALDDVDVDGDEATVRVTISNGTDGLMPGGWTERQSFDLVRVGGEWRLTGAPWPLFECYGGMPK